MVNDFEVIHMGGRTYNPVLGRFMQADPYIQQADNLQSLNRYSYVLNNPMSMTDPTGYSWVSKQWKKWGKTIVAAVASYYTFGAVSGMLLNSGGMCAINLTLSQTMITGAAPGFVGGAIISGNLKGAAKGFLTGALTGAVTGHLADSGTSFKDAAYRTAVSAIGGCAAGEASGGNCSDGARKAAMAQAVLVSMEAYSTYRHYLKGSEGEPVVKTYADGVHDPKVSNVGKSIEVLEKGDNNAFIGRKLSSLTVDEATKILQESVDGDLINSGKLWIDGNTVKFGLDTEQAAWLQTVAKIPGMNSMAVFHDKWMANIKANNSLVLATSIAPALYVNYTALGLSSYKYYARSINHE